MVSVIDIDDDTRAEYDAWILSDWSAGGDSTRFDRFLRYPIKIHQIVSCRDVSVSTYRLNGNDEEEEDDDKEEETVVISKKTASTRMLKMILYDGREHKVAYEYEPIACLDVFNANSLTGNPVRCCGKIALFNSPVERRGVLWLTQGNVKLVFEGYACLTYSGELSRCHSNVISQNFNAQESLLPEAPAPEKMESATRDNGYIQNSTLNGGTHGSCRSNQRDLYLTSHKRPNSDSGDKGQPIKRFNAYNVDDRGLSILESHFPVGSSYIEYSYVSYMLREGVAVGEDSFAAFAKDFFRIRGYDTHGSIAKLITHINKSPCFCQPGTTWFEEDLHYGFLEHAIPIGDVTYRQSHEMAIAGLSALAGKPNSSFWLVKLDDCVASFFCLVNTVTLGIAVESPLVTSNKLNSVEGFFQVKQITIAGNTLYWISKFKRTLSEEEFLTKTRTIEADFRNMEALLDF
ncbi:hypothetical protein BgAZ_501870 [Babesia gibsoni]|uniref:RecQ mediated genome instability protein 1 OB-fold domain-containing protein n=1 Tax=Babesia gibsoni TaxID=33632 RepID=A0AAD8P7Q5_BABGI|nr:hypothetical protein BgAZ_501870 [Babesia gibsoni]